MTTTDGRLQKYDSDVRKTGSIKKDDSEFDSGEVLFYRGVIFANGSCSTGYYNYTVRQLQNGAAIATMVTRDKMATYGYAPHHK